MQTYNKHLLEKYDHENSSQIKKKSFYAPHNTFIDVTTRLGFVGFSLFLYILFIFGRMGWQLIIRYTRDDFIKTWALCLTVVFTSFLIQGMFTDLLLGVQIIIFFILMAMMTVLWRLNKQMEDYS
jgi:O-antigen ligase